MRQNAALLERESVLTGSHPTAERKKDSLYSHVTESKFTRNSVGLRKQVPNPREDYHDLGELPNLLRNRPRMRNTAANDRGARC